MKDYLKEQELYWSMSSELMAEYNDGSHSEELADGSLEWWKNGNRHRDDDKPARIHKDGTLTWFKNGILHRDDDRPAVIYADGTLIWYKNGKVHRDDDRPAVIYADGTLIWNKNGYVHRPTGPAVINRNNKHEYWINGINITNEVKSWLKTRKYKHPFTPEQQVEIALTFS
jgi:hypothetical protein